MMWSVRYKNHIYILHNGELVYKNYDRQADGYKPQSILYNKHWPSVTIETDIRYRDGCSRDRPGEEHLVYSVQGHRQ